MPDTPTVRRAWNPICAAGWGVQRRLRSGKFDLDRVFRAMRFKVPNSRRSGAELILLMRRRASRGVVANTDSCRTNPRPAVTNKPSLVKAYYGQAGRSRDAEDPREASRPAPGAAGPGGRNSDPLPQVPPARLHGKLPDIRDKRGPRLSDTPVITGDTCGTAAVRTAVNPPTGWGVPARGRTRNSSSIGMCLL